MPHSLFARLAVVLAALGAVSAEAAPLDRATITEVVNRVTILDPATRRSRPAAEQALFLAPEVLRTGPDARAELVAPDRTVTRVGANTIFSFAGEGRAMELEKGSILFQSPSGQGGGSIRTPAASAAVLGTTIIVSATPDGAMKVLLIEGKGKVLLPDGEGRVLRAGQMVIVRRGQATGVLDFRLRDQATHARLIKSFKAPLPSMPKIAQAERLQQRELAQGRLAPRGERPPPPPRHDGQGPPPPPPGQGQGQGPRPPLPPPPPISRIDSTAVQIQKEQKPPPPPPPQGQNRRPDGGQRPSSN